MSTETLQKAVEQLARTDPTGLDLQLCMINAALASYKRRFLFKPLPAQLAPMVEGDDLSSLKSALEEIPSVESLAAGDCKLSWQAFQLAHFAAANPFFELKPMPVNETVDEIISQTGKPSYPIRPDHIYEVRYRAFPNRRSTITQTPPTAENINTGVDEISKHPVIAENGTNTEKQSVNETGKESNGSQAGSGEGTQNSVDDGKHASGGITKEAKSIGGWEPEGRFEKLKREYGVRLGYHGSPFENIYSIVNNGLQAHLNTTAVYGEGTYLSSDLAVAKDFAPNALAWKQSALAGHLACVCVCEMIDHPQLQKGKAVQPGLTVSEEGRLPTTYYIVRNNEHLRVKYLLVFGQGPAPSKRHTSGRSFLRRHPLFVALCLYMLLLTYIGLAKSPTLTRFLNRYVYGTVARR